MREAHFLHNTLNQESACSLRSLYHGWQSQFSCRPWYNRSANDRAMSEGISVWRRIQCSSTCHLNNTCCWPVTPTGTMNTTMARYACWQEDHRITLRLRSISEWYLTRHLAIMLPAVRTLLISWYGWLPLKR